MFLGQVIEWTNLSNFGSFIQGDEQMDMGWS